MPASDLTQPVVLSALNQSAIVPVAGYGGVGIQVQGTFSGTLTFEATVHGNDWAALSVTPLDGGTAVTTATAPGIFRASAVGYTNVRARMSSYSSGGASVIARTSISEP